MADAANRLAAEREHTTTRGALTALLVLVAAVVLGVNQLAVQRSPERERKYDGYVVSSSYLAITHMQVPLLLQSLP